ncbi:ABC transporter permease [Mesorhizobium sp. CA8]|uniref:ABC transporter permease n=1 Tax=unclassified Mesorhizobium TaxID=325217 RepID=UPI001CCD4A54|nr:MULTISPECIES: ABC transporter permease [unclassified Mesorhizobium]MBZ9761685.1 ABC transporter permease [Mesorhizobium sp. CA8]MBZ9820561.1 ABC transporter permease [Mesorhizobium sp. CA4]
MEREQNWSPVQGGAWLLRRALLGVATLLMISVVVFLGTQALPGDPAIAILGRDAAPDRVELLRQQLGLNVPVIQQYFNWLSGILHGDFGRSLASRRAVSGLLATRGLNSLLLVGLSAAICIPVSLALGGWSAMRRDKPADLSVWVLTTVLTALPEFIVGMVLVILFATTVTRLLPAVSMIPEGESPFYYASAFILPALTLVLATLPYLTRLFRGSMIEVLQADYVEMARLKGVMERRVVLRHAVPNALIPTVQGSALVLTYMAGGIVVVEYLFRFPGLGSALTDAIANRDLPVIQAIAVIQAALYVVVNLLADYLTIRLTPRLRTSHG